MIGNRYGTRMLPTRIRSNEFEILTKEIQENIEAYKEDLAFKNEEKTIDDSNVVEISYKLDENEVPQRQERS